MTESPEPRKSPYAVPLDRLGGDQVLDRSELVVEQPHEPPHEPPATGDADGD